LTALAQLKAGNTAEARAVYQRIADDLAAPQGLRARAAEILAWPPESAAVAAPPAAAQPEVAAPPPAAVQGQR
ncbi:MAG TPA: hypothetical protein VFK49_00930, partial [Stellaceae bacterium]|nr:hypothetical protein [Stellaceae bacterium]